MNKIRRNLIYQSARTERQMIQMPIFVICVYQAEKDNRIKREMESIWQSFCDKVLQLNIVVIATDYISVMTSTSIV